MSIKEKIEDFDLIIINNAKMSIAIFEKHHVYVPEFAIKSKEF